MKPFPAGTMILLEKLLQSKASIKLVDPQTIMVYDISHWNSQIQNEIMYHYPNCRIYIQMDDHYSVTGLIVLIRHPISPQKTFLLSVLYVFCVICCAYHVYLFLNK